MKNVSETLSCLLLQIDLLWQQPDQNLVRIASKIADTKNVDLIVLPELFSTGFCFDTHLAETMTGPTVKWMEKMAAQTGTHLMGSIMIKEDTNVYNRMLLVSSNGTIQYYDKKHLFAYGGENRCFTSGNEIKIFDINGWKIKPIICYDLRFPVAIRNVEDYDLLVCVANWPDKRVSAWDTLLKARAIENQCYVIGVNRVGKDENQLTYIGHSITIDPLGNSLTEISEKEALLKATLFKKEVTQTRDRFPFLDDRDLFSIN